VQQETTKQQTPGQDGLGKLKNPVTSSGIEPATFRFDS
jgi:hypothetical protein